MRRPGHKFRLVTKSGWKGIHFKSRLLEFVPVKISDFGTPANSVLITTHRHL